jgi:hypothetical protein
VAGCCECGDEPSGSCATEVVLVIIIIIICQNGSVKTSQFEILVTQVMLQIIYLKNLILVRVFIFLFIHTLFYSKITQRRIKG